MSKMLVEFITWAHTKRVPDLKKRLYKSEDNLEINTLNELLDFYSILLHEFKVFFDEANKSK